MHAEPWTGGLASRAGGTSGRPMGPNSQGLVHSTKPGTSNSMAQSSDKQQTPDFLGANPLPCRTPEVGQITILIASSIHFLMKYHLCFFLNKNTNQVAR